MKLTPYENVCGTKEGKYECAEPGREVRIVYMSFVFYSWIAKHVKSRVIHLVTRALFFISSHDLSVYTRRHTLRPAGASQSIGGVRLGLGSV